MIDFAGQYTGRIVEEIAQAASLPDPRQTVGQVGAILTNAILSNRLPLPQCFRWPRIDDYRTHLLYKADGFNIMAISWAGGQSTPIHDHAGQWCVEAVVEGHIQTQSFRHRGREMGYHILHPIRVMENLKPGQAACWVPPFEFHQVKNRGPKRAVAIQVCGGPPTWHNCYLERLPPFFLQKQVAAVDAPLLF